MLQLIHRLIIAVITAPDRVAGDRGEIVEKAIIVVAAAALAAAAMAVITSQVNIKIGSLKL